MLCLLEEVIELRYELAGLWCNAGPAGKVFVEYAPSLNSEASGGGSSVAYRTGDRASYTVPGLVDWYEALEG